MVTSCQVWPPSCVTKTPFHTQWPVESGALDVGFRSLAATRTFFGLVGLTAVHISSLGPAPWLARASQTWPHEAFMSRSKEPALQSSCQPPASAGCPAMACACASAAGSLDDADGDDGLDEQPASSSNARGTRVRTRRPRMGLQGRRQGKCVAAAARRSTDQPRNPGNRNLLPWIPGSRGWLGDPQSSALHDVDG